MPSRIVDLPAPFGPMMPVRPESKTIRVSACCRKLHRRSEFRCTISPTPSAVRRLDANGRRADGALRLAQVAQAQLDQLLAVDVGIEDAAHQLFSHHVR